MNKILVTGGAGFIGANLCEKLLDYGNNVICVDIFKTGKSVNIQHLLSNPKFKMISHDVTKPFTDTIFDDVTQIYNLACPSSPVHFREDPLNTLETSISGALNVIKLAIRLKCPILQTSSIRVSETDHTGPNACYTEGKRVVETMLLEYERKYGQKVRIARLGNTYGPKMALNDSKAIPQFITKAMNSERIDIWGDGKQIDSFLYITDCVDALIKFMNCECKESILNIGSVDSISIKEVVTIIIEALDSFSEIAYPNKDYKNTKPTEVDMVSARRILNWYPAFNLKEGVKETAAWFQYIS